MSLLSLYKLISRIIANRLNYKLELYQPKEQAGFRTRFSTIEHLHTARLLILRQPNIFLLLWVSLTFVKLLIRQKNGPSSIIKCTYRLQIYSTDLISKINDRATLKISLHHDTNTVPVNRGVGQSDVVSPKLSTLVLEDVLKRLNWEDRHIYQGKS